MVDITEEKTRVEQDRIRQVLNEVELARRSRLLRAFLLVLFSGVLSLAVTAMVVGVYSPTYDPWPRIGILTLAGLVCVVSFGLLRGGWVQAASWMFFLGTMVVVALAVLLIGFRGPESILFLLLIVMGGWLISGRASVILAGLAILSYVSVAVGELGGLYAPPLQLDVESNMLVTPSVRAVTFALMGLAAWFFARDLRDALGQARRQAATAQEKNVELEALKKDLEQRVAERTQALSRALETVAVLSAPVIPVMEGVIIIPLVGHADEERMHRVISSLLIGIRTYRARTAILDITGLVVVDTAVAIHLVEAAQGAQLLGCDLVLVGIRSEVAHTLVRLDVDLSAVITRANLQGGIEYAQRSWVEG